MFRDLLSLLSTLDKQLEDHLSTATVAKYTSNTIQNEILDCMFEVYQEDLLRDLKETNFVAIQADETTDITCRSQFVIIFRFIKDHKPVERFFKFVYVQSRTAVGLSGVLLQEFNNIDGFREKLIAQTYNGANVMSGSPGGVQTLVREFYPYARFVHCFAHQLNLVLKKLTDNIPDVRLFFTDLSSFSTFFSVSPKRSDVLRRVSEALPRPCPTRWNFQERLISKVNKEKANLIKCFEIISMEDGWDDTSRQQARGLQRLLEDDVFLYLLDFFDPVYQHVDVLYKTFQHRVTNGADATRAIDDFVATITKVREQVKDNPDQTSKRKKKDIKAAALEVCDILTIQLVSRLQESSYLSSFSVIDPKHFVYYQTHFPKEQIDCLLSNFPFFDKVGLTNELPVIYTNETFSYENCPTVLALYQTLASCELTSTFKETTKLLEVIITTPVSSAESERGFSFLKRIKTYLRNSMGQDRLNALTVLSIHKEYISDMPSFNKRVVDKFATMKNRRAEFLYK